MSLPIQGRRTAVVIDEGRSPLGEKVDGWTALHRVADDLERTLRAAQNLQGGPTHDPRRPDSRAPDGAAAEDQTGDDDASDASLLAPDQAESLLRRMRDLGRRDFAGLKRFLGAHPGLAEALHTSFETASLSAEGAGLYAGHGLGIPNADGWA